MKVLLEKNKVANDSASAILAELVEKKIYIIRGKKVMLDSDLAELYGVRTEVLLQAVKRNLGRFPDDFMYVLTKQELTILRSQIVISSPQLASNKGDINFTLQMDASKIGWGGRRYVPYAFTELGVAMLSSILRSERAIRVNIQIMRTFTRLRELLASNEMLRKKIEEMEKKYDQQFQIVFEAIKKLVEPPPEGPRKQIGFHAKKLVSGRNV